MNIQLALAIFSVGYAPRTVHDGLNRRSGRNNSRTAHHAIPGPGTSSAPDREAVGDATTDRKSSAPAGRIVPNTGRHPYHSIPLSQRSLSFILITYSEDISMVLSSHPEPRSRCSFAGTSIQLFFGSISACVPRSPLSSIISTRGEITFVLIIGVLQTPECVSAAGRSSSSGIGIQHGCEI